MALEKQMKLDDLLQAYLKDPAKGKTGPKSRVLNRKIWAHVEVPLE